MKARKKARAKLPPSFVPHDAVILNVDTAERSGWACYASGELWQRGEFDMLTYGGHAVYICRYAWGSAHVRGLPLFLVYERPFRGTTQGQWIGAWKAAFVAAGGRRDRMLGVYPATWRARVLGSGSLARDVARRREAALARQEAGEDVPPDAAAAICIGLWSRYCGEIGKRMPKRKKRAA